MTRKPWTPHDWKRTQDLLAQGFLIVQIAEMIGRTKSQVAEKVRWEKMTPAQREERAAKIRSWKSKAYYRERNLSPRKMQHTLDQRVDASPEAILARELRAAAPHRDLTGAFFGDPPVGFSALEQR
jgi:hypothetical protein